ncbi:MAG: ABC transporter permease [Paracoccaceae bacterium]
MKKRNLELDRSVFVQYAIWFQNMLQGDLGNSIYGSRVAVTSVLAEGDPRTLSLSLLAFAVALVIALPAGILSAVKRNTATDTTVSLLAFLGLSMPDFRLAILLIIVFAANLQWLPAIGYVPLSEGLWPWLSHLILPSIAIGTFRRSSRRMIRSSLLSAEGGPHAHCPGQGADAVDGDVRPRAAQCADR